MIGNSTDPFVPRLPDVTEYGSNFNLATSFNNFFIEKVNSVQDYIEKEKEAYQIHENTLNVFDSNDSCSAGPSRSGSQYLSEFRLCDIDELREIVSGSIKTTFMLDPLPSKVMSKCIDVLLPHLLDLVNTSLSTGSVDGVKFSFIRPLLKKIDLELSHLPSYRPISNLSFISKLVERVVSKRLNEHMTINNLHDDSQHGYKSNHSTETLLVRFLNDVLVAIDRNRGVVVLLIDLSSAFDTVQHSILLKILRDSLHN